MSKSMNTNFSELKHCYRVEVYQFGTGKRFVSNESFDKYEEAWEYAKNNASQFGACGYCVVELDEPEFELNINFDDINKYPFNSDISYSE